MHNICCISVEYHCMLSVCDDTQVMLLVDIVTRNTPLTSTTPALRCRLLTSGTTKKTEEAVGSRKRCIMGFPAVIEVAVEQTGGMWSHRCMTDEVPT